MTHHALRRLPTRARSPGLRTACLLLVATVATVATAQTRPAPAPEPAKAPARAPAQAPANTPAKAPANPSAKPAAAPAAAAPAAAAASAPFQPFVRLRAAPSDVVRDLAYSPDGRLLAIATGTVLRLWDAQRGIDVGYLAGHDQQVALRLAFSHDGKRLVSGGADLKFKIWDIESGEEQAHVESAMAFPTGLVFSPDGRWLALAGQKQAQVFDDTKGELRFTLDAAPGGAVLDPMFSADSQRLATRSSTDIRLWSMTDGKPLRTLLPRPGEKLLALSPGFHQVASSDSQKLHVVSLDNGQTVASAPASGVEQARFSADGRSLAWLQKDGQIGLWRIDGGAPLWAQLDRPVKPTRGSGTPHNTLAFSPDGRTLAVGSDDETVRLFDMKGRVVDRAAGRGPKLQRAVFSRDGSLLAVRDADGATVLLEVASGKLTPLRDKPAPAGTPVLPPATDHLGERGSLLDVSADGRTIASVSPAGHVRLHGRASGSELAFLGTASAKDLRFTRDGRLLFALEAGRVQVWGVATRDLVAQVALPAHLKDTRTIDFDTSGQQLWLWARGEKPHTEWIESRSISATGLGPPQRVAVPAVAADLGPDAALDAVISPDGRMLALSDNEDTRLIDLASGRVLHTLAEQPWYATRQFSPDGRVLMVFANGMRDHEVMRWDVATGKALAPLEGHQATVRGVAMSAEGRHIATVSDDRTVYFWNAKDGEALLNLGLLGSLAEPGWAVVNMKGQFEASSPAAEDAVLLRLGDARLDIVPATTQRAARYRPDLLRRTLNPSP